jgi:hypothetical protein
LPGDLPGRLAGNLKNRQRRVLPDRLPHPDGFGGRAGQSPGGGSLNGFGGGILLRRFYGLERRGRHRAPAVAADDRLGTGGAEQGAYQEKPYAQPPGSFSFSLFTVHGRSLIFGKRSYMRPLMLCISAMKKKTLQLSRR